MGKAKEKNKRGELYTDPSPRWALSDFVFVFCFFLLSGLMFPVGSRARLFSPSWRAGGLETACYVNGREGLNAPPYSLLSLSPSGCCV